MALALDRFSIPAVPLPAPQILANAEVELRRIMRTVSGALVPNIDGGEDFDVLVKKLGA